MEILPLEASWERKALNRTTFGCRSVDEAYVQQIGWDAWVEEQLNVPEGDDDELVLAFGTSGMSDAFGGKDAIEVFMMRKPSNATGSLLKKYKKE